MKKYGIYGICVVALIALMLVVPVAANETGETGGMKISVLDSMTGNVIKNADVLVFQPGTVITRGNTADGSAVFYLSPGNYSAKITAPGYQPVTADFEIVSGINGHLEVYMSPTSIVVTIGEGKQYPAPPSASAIIFDGIEWHENPQYVLGARLRFIIDSEEYFSNVVALGETVLITKNDQAASIEVVGIDLVDRTVKLKLQLLGV